MILTRPTIETALSARTIVIEPFNVEQLNPNSYNLRLGKRIMRYTTNFFLDPKLKQDVEEIHIPDEGLPLSPGKVYLCETLEYTETHCHVPMIEGRSSIGRLGLFVHVTAGFGDIGFCGKWTLELSCVQPIIIYPGMEICQIFYHTVTDMRGPRYDGKYQGNTGVQPSMMYLDP